MPAGSRPIWKGQLRLSLVTIPVELYTATKASARPAFNQIHAPTGKRVHYQKVVEGVGPVERSDIRKGYQYEKGEYVILEDEELDAVKLETRKTLELVQFVDEDEIPPLYFDDPYFVVPTDELAEDAFRVVRDALRQSKKLGLGQLAMRGQEYLVALRPCGKGMLLETLHYADEVRKPDTFFGEVAAARADPELLDVARALIEKKTARFDPGAFKDHYHEALRDLIERKKKLKGRKITAEEEPERPRGDNVIDLMSALKRSLEGGTERAASRPSSGRRSASRSGARKAPARKTAKKSLSRKKAS
ncbi:MAG TPA: Ku protein [Alphaproteobacteria bacterium]|nr:Ku protein [Alphaproteobacteria bacterium]